MTKAQPYSEDDFMRAVGIVQRLHGVSGFDAWVDLIAKELAEERMRAKEWSPAKQDYAKRATTLALRETD